MKKMSRIEWYLIFFFIIIIYTYSPLSASLWTEWAEYAANPVLDPASGVRAYYPSVTYDRDRFGGHGSAAYYKMWFASPDSGVGGIAFAASDDGIGWTEYNNSLPLPGLLAGANHPVVLYDPNGFGGGGFTYKIWYWDSSVGLNTINAIRTAESADGITWQNDQPIQQHPGDPALQPVAGFGVYNNYFYHCYGPGSVLYNADGANTGAATPDDKTDDAPMTYRYVMYYDSSTEGFSPNGSVEQTSLAYSTDGIYWVRYGDEPVVLPSGDPADWDGLYAFHSCVLRIDGTYHLWYAGANGDNSIGTYYAHGIGHAVSDDGLNWTKDGDNPAVHVGDGVAWRDVRSYTPSVIYDGDRFSGHGESCLTKIWFTGRTGSNYTIGYAAICPPPGEPPMARFACIRQGLVEHSRCFDGADSSDPDGDAITEFAWSLVARPTGSGADILPADAAVACLVPDVPGRYTIGLRAASTNSLGETLWSEQTTCVYRAWLADHLPIAVITALPITGKVGQPVMLDGSESYDADGEAIGQYAWSLEDRPAGSNCRLIATDTPHSSFIPDAEGVYTVCLRVASLNRDGQTVWSEPACIAITVQGYAYCHCPEVSLTVERLEDRMWHRTYKVARLTWTVKERAPACPVKGFRIYRFQAGAWQTAGEVNADVRQYEDSGVAEWYDYRVVPLLSDGEECH